LRTDIISQTSDRHLIAVVVIAEAIKFSVSRLTSAIVSRDTVNS